MGVDGGFVALFLLTNSVSYKKDTAFFNNYFIHYFRIIL